MSEDEKKRLLDQLAASRSLKKHGARATNKAVAMDALQTSNQIGLMVRRILPFDLTISLCCRLVIFPSALVYAPLRCSPGLIPTTP
jgi:hypothetical protein